MINHTTQQTRTLAAGFFAFFVIGMAVLMTGAIMPHLRTEYHLSYTLVGFFLALQAIGGFISNFICPALIRLFGRKTAITIITAIPAVSFIVIMFAPSTVILGIAFVFSGIGTNGIANIYNNLVNEVTKGKASFMNILHSFFAVGAFTAPIFSSQTIQQGKNWRFAVSVLVVMFVTSLLLNLFLLTSSDKAQKTQKTQKNLKAHQKISSEHDSWLRQPKFYLMCFILFAYVGLEGTINGWFITYLQNTGFMTPAFASTLLSLLWLIMIAGRVVIAALSRFVSKKRLVFVTVTGSLVFLVVLIFAQNIQLVALAMIGLGLFMSGLYPTGISAASDFINGKPEGMSVLMAISGAGGIVTPQIIGSLADFAGIQKAMGFLLFICAVMFVLAAINNFFDIDN